MRARLSSLATLLVMTSFSGVSSAYAGAFSSTVGSREMAGVKLDESVNFTSSAGTIALRPVLSAVRMKKIVLFWADVYVTQISVPTAITFTPTSASEALKSLREQPMAAISLRFLRTVEPSVIKNAFIDGLKANEEDPNDPGLKSLLQEISSFGDFLDKSTFRVGFTAKGAQEEVILERDDKSKTILLPAGTVRKIWSIWLGKPADSGITEMQKQFFKGATPTLNSVVQ